MKKLFFCIMLVIPYLLNGMEENPVVLQDANSSISEHTIIPYALQCAVLNKKIDALSEVVLSQAQLIRTMATGVQTLITSLDQHGESSDSVSASIDHQSSQLALLNQRLKPISDYFQDKKKSQGVLIRAIFDEIDAALDSINNCEDKLDDFEDKIKSNMGNLATRVQQLEKRITGLESSNNQDQQEQSEEKDPKEKND